MKWKCPTLRWAGFSDGPDVRPHAGLEWFGYQNYADSWCLWLAILGLGFSLPSIFEGQEIGTLCSFAMALANLFVLSTFCLLGGMKHHVTVRRKFVFPMFHSYS